MKDFQITEYKDWKDIEGVFDSIGKALGKMGISMVDNPFTEGTDCYSFILVRKGIDRDVLFDQIKPEVMMENGIEEDEMEDGSTEDTINRETEDLVEEFMEILKKAK